MGCGEQCVVICGEQQMQLWCAGNLGSPVQVRKGENGRKWEVKWMKTEKIYRKGHG